MVAERKWIEYCDEVEFEYNDEESEKKKSKAIIDVFVPHSEDENFNECFDATGFVRLYKEFYFLRVDEDNRFCQKDNCPQRVNKSNQANCTVEGKLLENEDSVMYKDTWEPIDVFNILAWKTGNINHQRSNEIIHYKNGWHADIEKNAYKLKLRSFDLEGDGFREFANRINNLRNQYIQNPESCDVFDCLMKEGGNTKGLGTVYLITLLFFITKGKYPIYDRFAMAALLSLLLNENGKYVSLGDSIIQKTNLPEKREIKKLQDIKLYSNYIGLLYHFFGNAWKENRDIDRALWVYGHFFKVP